MDLKTYIQQQLGNARRLVDTVVTGTTDDQFNWLPPGTLNPISAILVHVVAGEDFFIQGILLGQRRLWEAQGWGPKIGLELPPSPGHGWDECRCTRLTPAPMLDYSKAVRAATEAYLANLTEAELNRQVNFAGRTVPVSDMLMTLVVHQASHAGEMAAIKGMQGVQGMPF
jgi:hypothetical protein